MKSILTCISFSVFSIGIQSQITISGFPKEVSCEIGFTEELPHPVATSTCGRVKTTISEEAFSGGCAGTLVRTFSYSDDCGNKATAQQYIHLLDTESPVLLGVPENVVLTNDSIPVVPQVISIDNSKDMPPVQFSEERIDNVIIRKWSATDRCDNIAEAEQRITLPLKNK